jgi:tripartite-type tricarboxylate transporter receptor subunit TctC
VPYKGSAPALTDLIAGRVQLMIDNLRAAQPFAESNSIRPLAA